MQNNKRSFRAKIQFIARGVLSNEHYLLHHVLITYIIPEFQNVLIRTLIRVIKINR